jgi:hypothetical protein
VLLAALGYLREYRTYAHIAADFGIAESNLFSTVRWVENTLIKDGRFHLPGKKALAKNDVQYEVAPVDATETTCERPNDNSGHGTAARKNGTR